MPSYYSAWKDDDYSCDRCGWKGKGGELKQGELCDVAVEECCPHCGEGLEFIAFPTLEDAFADWDRVPERDRKGLRFVSEAHAAYERALLRTPDQLPTIPGDGPIALVWDFVEIDERTRTTVIRCGDQVVWEEPATWEGARRFDAIATILAQRYGTRLFDLIPTQRSLDYLYGEKLYFEDVVVQARVRLRANAV